MFLLYNQKYWDQLYLVDYYKRNIINYFGGFLQNCKFATSIFPAIGRERQSGHPITVEVKVNKQPLVMELDTGAEKTVSSGCTETYYCTSAHIHGWAYDRGRRDDRQGAVQYTVLHTTPPGSSWQGTNIAWSRLASAPPARLEGDWTNNSRRRSG